MLMTTALRAGYGGFHAFMRYSHKFVREYATNRLTCGLWPITAWGNCGEDDAALACDAVLRPSLRRVPSFPACRGFVRVMGSVWFPGFARFILFSKIRA